MASSSDDDDDDENVPLTTVTLDCLALGERHVFSRRLRNIGSLKSHIANYYGIPFTRQIIVHQGTLMMNDAKEFTDVRDEFGKADIEVYTKMMESEDVEVVVETPTGDVNLEIRSEATIAYLKRMIDERKGIPPRRQELTVMGVVMDNNSHLIEDYITNLPLQINLTEIPPDPTQFVRVNLINEHINREASVDVEILDTIYTLQAKARRVGIAQGFNFYFVYNGYGDDYEFSRLMGQSTLYSYGIEDGANLYVHYD